MSHKNNGSTTWIPPTCTTVTIGGSNAATAAAATNNTKKRNGNGLHAPITRGGDSQNYNPKDHPTRRTPRSNRQFWILVIWLTLLTLWTLWIGWRYVPYHTITQDTDVYNDSNTVTLAADVKHSAAVSSDSGRRHPHRLKIYPFNIYETAEPGTTQSVRYPTNGGGGIPELVWQDVKYFRTCCKNDHSFRCFPPENVALRRDPERTRRSLPDVYLEISAGASIIAPVGARCQLTWSTEHADVET